MSGGTGPVPFSALKAFSCRAKDAVGLNRRKGFSTSQTRSARAGPARSDSRAAARHATARIPSPSGQARISSQLTLLILVVSGSPDLRNWLSIVLRSLNGLGLYH